MYGERRNEPRERFIEQFEWEGDDTIYRADRVGPAYRVTSDEYHRFLDDYDRRRWVTTVILLAGYVLIMAAFLLLPPFSKFLGPTKGLPLLGPLLGVSLSWSQNRWRAHAPNRAMRQRVPFAPALSGDDRLERTVGERSWPSLFGEAVIFGLMFPFAILLFDLSRWHDPIVWLLFAGYIGAVGFTSTQMLRK